jgi:hypothetical protein
VRPGLPLDPHGHPRHPLFAGVEIGLLIEALRESNSSG